MNDVSTFRLYFLRAAYLLLAVGGSFISWLEILDPTKKWELMSGVVVSMLGAMSILAVLGIRYPLQMLPLLFWELTWKTIWLLRVAFPIWRSHQMDQATADNVFACSLAVIVAVAIPWRYVFEHYVTKAGDSWRRPVAPVRSDPDRSVGSDSSARF